MRVKATTVVCAFLILVGFGFTNGQHSTSGQRLTQAEITKIPASGAVAGTAGLRGIQTRILKGDPNKDGLYTIQLTVPANTRIEAHTHPDDRVATVIAGTWYIGYGNAFSERSLKALSPGSFYTEPPNAAHFARTADQSVVLQISGYGPTGTKYLDAK